MTEILRAHAEDQHADELAALAKADGSLPAPGGR